MYFLTGDLISAPGFPMLFPGGADMAGKISLFVIVGFLLCGFGYAAGKLETRDTLIPFKVVQVARESDPDRNTLSGLKSPFTLLVHETRINLTLAGELGSTGDIVFLPDPRQKSESTIVP